MKKKQWMMPFVNKEIFSKLISGEKKKITEKERLKTFILLETAQQCLAKRKKHQKSYLS